MWKSLQEYETGNFRDMFEITSLRRTLTQSQVNLIFQRINYLNTYALFEQLLGVSLERVN